MASNILLMTATITPPAGVPNLSRTDPAQRLKDYEKSLSWYISQSKGVFSKIVFVDNSCSDLQTLQAVAKEQGAEELVEFISFQGLDYPAHFDRAYGEFKLLDYAMSHSKSILGAAGDSTVIWKVTGRYMVRNIAELVSNSPKQFMLYGNYRNWPKRWIDTYLLAWTPEGYEFLFRDVYHRLKTNVPGIPLGIAGEELFRSWLEQPLFRKSRIVKRFKTTPEIDGVRGADGRQYSVDGIWKQRIRTWTCRFLPFVWI